MLTASGVAVGSIAVLLLVSIGVGVEKDIKGQVEGLGVNLLIVVPGQFNKGFGFNPNLAGQSYLKESHAESLERLNGVVETALLTFAGGGVRKGNTEAFPFVIACSPEWFSVRPVQLAEGAVFEKAESRHVVVLGQIAKEELFGKASAVGQSVTVSGKSYKVVGVTKETTSGSSLFAMQGFENVAYIPYETLKKENPATQIDRIFLKTAPDVEPKSLVDSVTSELGKSLDQQQFGVLTQEDLLGLIYKVFGILGTLVVGLTAISLFIGGVGVMTVMLLGVNERRKEIGVRKATGATRRHIFWQFLTESTVTGVAGVVLGLLFSSLVIVALARATSIKPVMTPATVLMAVGIGLGLGSLFGVLPAIRAAKQDPITALRME